MVGECREIMLCDAREAVACAREHRNAIIGVKVRVGRIASGSSGVAPMDIAMEAADRLVARLQLPNNEIAINITFGKGSDASSLYISTLVGKVYRVRVGPK